MQIERQESRLVDAVNHMHARLEHLGSESETLKTAVADAKSR